MIIGNGLLASSLRSTYEHDLDVVIFASGVSNSDESRASEFEREKLLLRETLDYPAKKKLIYFGSCGVSSAEESRSPYMHHKMAMETMVLTKPHGLVLRLPQVVGRATNPHTLANYLRNHISEGRPFTVWAHAERNLIDIDDVVAITRHLAEKPISNARVIPVASLKSLMMPDIVALFEAALGKRAICTYVERGVPMKIDTSIIKTICAELRIDLGGDYTKRIIEKYYAPSSKHTNDH